ncbi:MAG: DUF4337 domain-containing protein [Alphaproteobacteria bacterium]|nr:DUF4337 domain-containing protein [Alphaproteobacteria bacterium]
MSAPTIEGGNKATAIIIALLAAFLAVVETAGKSAESEATAAHIAASDLWAFFQAKTIRQTMARTASEALAIMAPESGPKAEAAVRQIETWRTTIARWESEPDTQEGRKELSARARAKEAERDRYKAKNEMFELSSAALQLAIVLTSASIVTSMILLLYCGLGLGSVAVVLAMLGWFAPTLIHL